MNWQYFPILINLSLRSPLSSYCTLSLNLALAKFQFLVIGKNGDLRDLKLRRVRGDQCVRGVWWWSGVILHSKLFLDGLISFMVRD